MRRNALGRLAWIAVTVGLLLGGLRLSAFHSVFHARFGDGEQLPDGRRRILLESEGFTHLLCATVMRVASTSHDGPVDFVVRAGPHAWIGPTAGTGRPDAGPELGLDVGGALLIRLPAGTELALDSRLEVRAPVVVRDSLGIAGVVLMLAGGCVGSAGVWLVVRVVGLGALAAMLAGYLVTTQGVALVSPDSYEYLSGDAFRSPGMYWLSTALIRMSGGLHGLSAIQGLLFAGSAILLGCTTRRALVASAGPRGSAVVAWCVVMACLASPMIWRFGPALLTEAISGAALAASTSLVAAAVIRDEGMDASSRRAVLVASLILGAATLVRTTALLAVPAHLLLLMRGKRSRLSAALVYLAPLAIALLVQCGWSHLRFGVFGLPQISGPALLGNVAPLVRSGDPTAWPRIAESIAEQVDRLDARIQWSEPLFEWTRRSSGRYNDLLWREGGAWEAVQGEIARSGREDPNDVQASRLANEFAWEMVRQHPLEYGRFVSGHFIRLYALSGMRPGLTVRAESDASTLARIDRQFGRLSAANETRPAPLALQRLERDANIARRLPLADFRWLLALTVLAGVLWLVRGRLCGPAWIWIAALCMTTACIYAGTAFFQVSLQRYADPLAPLLFAASATAVASACAWLARRLPTAPAAAHRAGGA